MISNQMRNLTIGLIGLLSMGCNIFLPKDAYDFDKIPPEVLTNMWKDARKKGKEERRKQQDQQRQQQDEQSNTNLIDDIDNKVWQENGGRYNILFYHIIVDGIGPPPQDCKDNSGRIKWVRAAKQYWVETGQDIMEQKLKEGHPSAILWSKNGKSFDIGSRDG